MNGWIYIWHVITGHEWSVWVTYFDTRGIYFECQRRVCKVCGASEMRRVGCRF